MKEAFHFPLIIQHISMKKGRKEEREREREREEEEEESEERPKNEDSIDVVEERKLGASNLLPLYKPSIINRT